MPISDPSPRGLDFFCSAGALSLGFPAVGCRIVAAVDHDTTAGKTFSRNLGGLPAALSGGRGDLKTLDHKNTFGSVAPGTVIGEPFCRAYSRIGHANFVNLSGQGFKEDPPISPYDRIVEAITPWQPRVLQQVVVLELGSDRFYHEVRIPRTREQAVHHLKLWQAGSCR